MKAIVAVPTLIILLVGGMELNCTNDTLLLIIALITAGWLASDD